MTTMLIASPWAGILVWILLYVSDYSLTLACARRYRAQSKVMFEGSFELNPVFQADVDSLRRLSPRFLIALASSVALLYLLWWLCRQPPYPMDSYLFTLGAALLLQATIHIRHLRNLLLFT